MRAIPIEQPIFEGDTIITGNDGQLQVHMNDDAIIAVRANSKLKAAEKLNTTNILVAPTLLQQPTNTKLLVPAI